LERPNEHADHRLIHTIHRIIRHIIPLVHGYRRIHAFDVVPPMLGNEEDLPWPQYDLHRVD
jgi:hypothetical protein